MERINNQPLRTKVLAPAAPGYHSLNAANPSTAGTVIITMPGASRGLLVTGGIISQGLAQRLFRYARQVMEDVGFAALTAEWEPSVYTVDGDDRPADRSYCVRWQNEKGGYIEVIGILTRKGWPTLNHGFAIGDE